MTVYYVFVWDDAQPELSPAYAEHTDENLVKYLISKDYDRDSDGIYLLEIDDQGKPSIHSFSGRYISDLLSIEFDPE